MEAMIDGAELVSAVTQGGAVHSGKVCKIDPAVILLYQYSTFSIIRNKLTPP